MIEATDLTNFILIISAVLGGGFAPLIVFFARLWQNQKSLEERLDSSIEIRKTMQEDLKRQADIFNPQFQKALVDIALMREKIVNINDKLERIESNIYNGWHPIHKPEEKK